MKKDKEKKPVFHGITPLEGRAGHPTGHAPVQNKNSDTVSETDAIQSGERMNDLYGHATKNYFQNSAKKSGANINQSLAKTPNSNKVIREIDDETARDIVKRNEDGFMRNGPLWHVPDEYYLAREHLEKKNKK